MNRPFPVSVVETLVGLERVRLDSGMAQAKMFGFHYLRNLYLQITVLRLTLELRPQLMNSVSKMVLLDSPRSTCLEGVLR